MSAGHGRALLALEDEAAILEAAQTALKKHLNGRETEKMAQSAQNQPQKRVQPEKDHYYTELELALTQVLGRPGHYYRQRQKQKTCSGIF